MKSVDGEAGCSSKSSNVCLIIFVQRDQDIQKY